MHPVGQEATRLLPISPSDFVLAANDATLTCTFADGDDLPATSWVVDQGGTLLVYER